MPSSCHCHWPPCGVNRTQTHPVLVQQERDDLEARINNASVRIDAAKDHRSSLASTNQQLVRRAGDAAAALLDVRRASQAADQATTPPTATPSAVVGAAGASPNITSASTTVSVYMPVPRPRPVDAFAHHVPLSLDAVLAHAPQDPYASPHGSFGDGAQSPDNLPGMVAAYKSDVAATVRRPIADICWFIQTPYQAAPAAMLSFTTTMSSLECCASFLVFYFATTLEGAFMAQECALADGSATPGAPPLPHPCTLCTPRYSPWHRPSHGSRYHCQCHARAGP